VTIYACRSGRNFVRNSTGSNDCPFTSRTSKCKCGAIAIQFRASAFREVCPIFPIRCPLVTDEPLTPISAKCPYNVKNFSPLRGQMCSTTTCFPKSDAFPSSPTSATRPSNTQNTSSCGTNVGSSLSKSVFEVQSVKINPRRLARRRHIDRRNVTPPMKPFPTIPGKTRLPVIRIHTRPCEKPFRRVQ
jgi:hypothetical protein